MHKLIRLRVKLRINNFKDNWFKPLNQCFKIINSIKEGNSYVNLDMLV
jgi:hypothetical protein